MRLLVQASDFGFTRASVYGVIDAVDLGLVRNAGLFTNMPDSKFAVEMIKSRPQVCLGLDFNLTSGPCVCDPADIPHLTDQSGRFIRSPLRVKDPRFQTRIGRNQMFPYEECLREMRAQYDRFVTLTGQKPGYLHDHSLAFENYADIIRRIAQETGVPYTRDILKKYRFGSLGRELYPEAFSMDKSVDYEKQAKKDPEKIFWDHIDQVMEYDYFILSGHAAYVDAGLLELTTCSIERCKDAALCMSPRLKAWVRENHIDLITYYDLQEYTH